MQRPAPAQRPPGGVGCPATGPQRATGPLVGPSAGGPNDGDSGGDGMVAALPPTPPSLRRGTRSGESWAGDSLPLTHCDSTARAETSHPLAANTLLSLVLIFPLFLTYHTLRCPWAAEKRRSVSRPPGVPARMVHLVKLNLALPPMRAMEGPCPCTLPRTEQHVARVSSKAPRGIN